MFRSFVTTCLLFLTLLPLGAISGIEIVREVEKRGYFENSYSEGVIESTDRLGSSSFKFKSFSEGDDKVLIELDEQKILKLGETLYLFYPDADVVIRLQGSALRQTILGSDLSYQDMTQSSSLLNEYDVKLLNEDENTYLLELNATKKSVAYPKQLIWVDKKNYTINKRQLSTKEGRLLKEIEVIEFVSYNHRLLPKVTLVTDVLKKNSSTKMILNKFETDLKLDPLIFSIQNLKW